MGSVDESLYKCCFCNQRINRYSIEEHFETIHMFKSLDYICEFCNEIFETQNDLIKHVGIHDAKKSESKLNSFEEGKSKFLAFVTSFNSEKDSFMLLDWINESLEDLRLFIREDLKSCDDFDNQALTLNQNHTMVNNDGNGDQDEEILSRTNCESEYKEIQINNQKASNDFTDQENRVDPQNVLNMEQNIESELENDFNDQENRVEPQNTLNMEQNIESDIEKEPENDLNFSNQEIVDYKSPQESTGNDTLVNDPVYEIDGNSDLNSLFDYALDSENEKSDDLKMGIKKEYSCVLCSKSLSSEKQLKDHMIQKHKAKIVHKTEKDFVCNTCNKSFNSEQQLKTHMIQKHDCKDYVCVDCGKELSSEFFLKKHMNSVHNSQKDNKCGICGKIFIRKLKRHINAVHKTEKGFVCETCNKSFNVKAKLKKHMTIHEGRKDWTCDSCGKAYSSRQMLKIHIQTIHEGRKDYECDSCGKLFPTITRCNNHIKLVHEERKDHKCKLCEKSFFVKATLQIHINTVHEGQKNYSCDSCGKKFGQASSLKVHIRGVHEGYKKATNKVYKCYACDCGEKFSKEIDFKNHTIDIQESWGFYYHP